MLINKKLEIESKLEKKRYYSMKKIKLISLFILSFLFTGLMGGVFAFPSMIETFSGGSHTGCHGSASESVNATLTLTSLQGTTVSPSQQINLTAEVSDFTEAITGERGSEFSIAVAPTRGDNADFASQLSEPIRYSGVSLDGTGASGVLNFVLFAPSSPGTYVLVVDAINGINHTDDSAFPIIFATASLTITVSATTAIPGFNVIIIATVTVLTLVPIILIIHRKKRE